MRQTLEVVGEGAQRAGEVLHVMPRRHVAGVACFQLAVQALHQLILDSGGDYFHACLYTRILTRTAKENYSSSRHWKNSVFSAQNRAKAILLRVYIDIKSGRIAQNCAKPYIFLSRLNVSRQLVKVGRRQAPARLPGTGARPQAWLGLGQGHGVQAPGEGARRVVGLAEAKTERRRLLVGLPDVLLPERSVKC